MLLVLKVVTVFLAGVAMSLALAHALELPGKMRLEKGTYIAVQAIYYPGFTYGGSSEGLAILAAAALIVVTPAANPAFWWTLTGLVALVFMHAAYWVLIHPVNKFWLKGMQLEGAAGGFFSLDPLKQRAAPADNGEAWKGLRDRWEYSHLLRAVLSVVALIALITAVAI